jgi:hypothetical protein
MLRLRLKLRANLGLRVKLKLKEFGTREDTSSQTLKTKY